MAGKAPAIISPSTDVSPWLVLNAAGVITYLPNFQGMPQVISPGRSSRMIRAVNSRIQSSAGDGIPEAGFLSLTGALITASGANAALDLVDALRTAIENAVRLVLVDSAGVRYWDVLPGVSKLEPNGAWLNPIHVNALIAVSSLTAVRAASFLDGRVSSFVGAKLVDGSTPSSVGAKLYDGGLLT